MGIQDLVTLGVDGTTEGVPEFLDSLDSGFILVAGVRADEELTLVGHDLFLQGRDDVLHHIPVVIGVRHHREAGVGVEFSEEALDKGALITIQGEVGTHHGVLGGDGTHTDVVEGAVSVIVLIQVRDGGNGAGLVGREQPGGGAADGLIHTGHAAHTEVCECVAGVDTGIGILVIPVLGQLVVHMADGGVVGGLPEFRLEDTFDPLNQPGITRKGIGEFDAGDTHIDQGSFRQGVDFQGEVTELVEIDDLLHIIVTLAKLDVHGELVVLDDLVQRKVEEVLLEVLQKPLLDECLDAEPDHLLVFGLLEHGFTGDPVGHELVKALGIHTVVSLLVSVRQQNCGNVNHNLYKIFNCMKLIIF